MSHGWKTPGALFALIAALCFAFAACDGPDSPGDEPEYGVAVEVPDELYAQNAAGPRASFTGKDARRKQVNVRLTPIASSLPQITDLQFAPGVPHALFVALKTGELYVLDVRVPARRPRLIQKLRVTTRSEQGLLGVAFARDFHQSGRMYLHYTIRNGSRDMNRVATARFTNPGNPVQKGQLSGLRTLLEARQPYANHNGGQIAVDSEGMLLIGLGDGGSRDDPKRHGQNPRSLLGAILRIDPTRSASGRQYAIPANNPYARSQQMRPEIYAWGLRNPWRFSIEARGRVVVADVGQDRYEEVNVIASQGGGNFGWDLREARHCNRPKRGCSARDALGTKLVSPIYEYEHDEGRSITGGYVYAGRRIPALRGKYVFGDFVTGRIWAIDLPGDSQTFVTSDASLALGKWPVLISTFGRDAGGEIYVGDFNGSVYRLDP